MPCRPRVLITRARHQASALAAKLEAAGMETILVPTIELGPPTAYEALDAALDELSKPAHAFDWLVFTSANAVSAFEDRRSLKGVEIHPHRIAAIGPATLKALADAAILPGADAVLMPETYVAEPLAASLLAIAGTTPKRFLLIRAEEARDVIPRTLEAAGHSVTIAAAYRNIMPAGTIPMLQLLFASSETQPEIITFTSSSTARNLFALLDAAQITLPEGIVLASIGPITTATLRELGYEPAIEAVEPTIDSLAEAIAAGPGTKD